MMLVNPDGTLQLANSAEMLNTYDNANLMIKFLNKSIKRILEQKK